jgi:hypothetical protein
MMKSKKSEFRQFKKEQSNAEIDIIFYHFFGPLGVFISVFNHWQLRDNPDSADKGLQISHVQRHSSGLGLFQQKPP